MRPAKVSIAISLAAAMIGVGSGLAWSAEITAVEQDLVNVKASNQVASAVWKRLPDSYVLQIVLDRDRFAERRRPDRAAQFPAPRSPPVTVTREEMDRLGIVSAAEAQRELAPRTVQGEPGRPDRGALFIGSTIVNLRGIDPWFACGRTLTLIDGRRTFAQNGLPLPPPPAIPPSREMRVEAWLLKADGTVIPHNTYVCEDPLAPAAIQDRASITNRNVTVSYGYAIADMERAAAVAIRIDGDFFIEKLQPLVAPTAAP